MRKLIAIWLDGYDLSLANAMIDELPSLARIREPSARFLLDHSSARWIGVAEEHVSSGLSPNDAERWSVIFFDKETYEVWQEHIKRPDRFPLHTPAHIDASLQPLQLPFGVSQRFTEHSVESTDPRQRHQVIQRNRLVNQGHSEVGIEIFYSCWLPFGSYGYIPLSFDERIGW